MKRMFAPVVGALLVIAMPANAAQQPSPAQAPDPAKLAEAHAIIEIMFPPAEREHMFGTVLDLSAARGRAAAMSTNVASDPGFKSILDNYADQALAKVRPLFVSHVPQLLDAMAEAYTREFSLAELRDIHAFALSPAGRHFLRESAAAVSDPDTSDFSPAELKDIDAFALSPAGHHFLSTSVTSDPATVKAMADFRADEQQQLAPLISQLNDNIAAYRKAHPSLANKRPAEGGAK